MFSATGVFASPAVDGGEGKGFRYEEYQIEHEISSAQARNSAKAIDLSRGKKTYLVLTLILSKILMPPPPFFIIYWIMRTCKPH